MQINHWEITSREEWLERRRKNINGSEIGALFGCSPFLTPYALYADKTGLADMNAPDNDVMRRGRILEPAVALAVQEDRPDWIITKATDYLSAADLGLGCTPDFYVECPERGRGVLQAKTTAKKLFEEKWQDGPPQWIVLQTLLEMMLANVRWGAIAVLITDTFNVGWEIYEFERHAGAEARIIEAARQFWDDLAAGKEPKPDYSRDDDVIRSMFPQDNGKTVDLSADNRMPKLLDNYETFKTMKKHAEDNLKAINAEISEKMGDAAFAIVPGWDKVSLKTQTRKAHEVKESTFRVLRVKRAAEQQEAA